MGPAKDKHGVRESFAKVKFLFAKNGRSGIKEFWSTTIYIYIHIHIYIYIYIYIYPEWYSKIQGWKNSTSGGFHSPFFSIHKTSIESHEASSFLAELTMVLPICFRPLAIWRTCFRASSPAATMCTGDARGTPTGEKISITNGELTVGYPIYPLVI